MLRNVDLTEISDGKFYTSGDLVKADCNGCVGCSECCRDMGSSIVLDPYDIYQLTTNLSCRFEDLLKGYIELNVVDGIILPNIKMSEQTNGCPFLSDAGRCRIHSFRPGFCRLFPLGRIYEDHSFRYFLQTKECPKENKTKIKIKKWLGIRDLKQYEAFVCDWHYFLKKHQEKAMSPDADAKDVKSLSMDILRRFYLPPYDGETPFYTQFQNRL